MFNLGKILISALLVILVAFFADAIFAKDNLLIQAAVNNLAAPKMITFDDQGRMLIAESGTGGSGEAKLTRIEKSGAKTTLVAAKAFDTELPLTAVALYQGKIYLTHAGTVSLVNDDGSLTNAIEGLPGQGDYPAGQIVFKDGWMYLAVGTVTNSGVVGADNLLFGWLKNPDNKLLHDIPCTDISVTNQTFGSPETSPFAEFRVNGVKDLLGTPYCNGAILKAKPDGTGLSVYVWGLRDPAGLKLGPDNNLYVSNHGFEARGLRPIGNAWDCFYKVTEGAWYGWPDFACDEAVTDPKFLPKDQPQPQFILKNHPTEFPPQPLAKLNSLSDMAGFVFAQGNWGKPTDVLIALGSGKVIKLDTQTGKFQDLLSTSLKHPVDLTFGPHGTLYITDLGDVQLTKDGFKVGPNSGVIWKVTQNTSPAKIQISPKWLIFTLIVGLALVAAYLLRARPR